MMPTLAHFYGLHEVGVFVLPAALAILALRWAERKAKRSAAEREASTEPEEQVDVE